jgi:hypothetical protein
MPDPILSPLFDPNTREERERVRRRENRFFVCCWLASVVFAALFTLALSWCTQ